MARGFTLVETLIVLVVIGVALAAVGLGFAGATGRDAEREVERIHLLLQKIAEKAQISGRPHAFELLPGGYRTLVADASGQWVADRHSEFGERILPEGLRWQQLEINDIEQPLPGRIIFSSRTPRFVLRVSRPGQQIALRGYRSGSVAREAPEITGTAQ